MLTYEDCVAFSGNTNYSVAAPVATGEAAAPDSGTAQATPLRCYRSNTSQALARLLALSLLADGRMDPREVAFLCSDDGLGRLGVSNKEFFQVLYDFCADVSRMPAAGGSYNVPREDLKALLGEVDDPSLRIETLDLMVDVFGADGELDHGEAALLWNVLDAWDLSSSPCSRTPTSASRAIPYPRAH